MYHVLFAPNDVRQMTLDQVDDCFRLGLITEETWLWTDGMKGWETLKDAAGLSEPGTSSKAPPPPRRGGQTAETRTASSASPSRGGSGSSGSSSSGSGRSGSGSSRRPTRAEPPPRRRAAAASRAASSPEVITSARPMQLSQPARGGNPFLQTASTAVAEVVAARPNAAPAYQPQQPYYGQAAVQLAPAPAAPVATATWPSVAPTSTVRHSGHATAASPAVVNHAHTNAPYSQPTPYPQPTLAQPAYAPTAYSQPAYARPAYSPAPNSLAPNSLAPIAMTAAPARSWEASDLDDVPFARRSRGAGSRVQGWLLTLCLLAGAGVVAYRNDYVFQLAKSFRQESAYLALERRYLGGAPDGTPRDVEKLVEGIAPAIQTVVFGRDSARLDSEPLGGQTALGAAGVVPNPVPEASAVTPTPSPTPEAAKAEAKADAVERLTPEKSSVIPESAPKGTNTRSVVAPRAAEARPEPARRSFSAQASDDSEKPSRASRERAQKSEAESRAEPMPAAGTDDFLHMSMRQAIKKKSGSAAAPSESAPKKKKSSRADYDPLNGEI